MSKKFSCYSRNHRKRLIEPDSSSSSSEGHNSPSSQNFYSESSSHIAQSNTSETHVPSSELIHNSSSSSSDSSFSTSEFEYIDPELTGSDYLSSDSEAENQQVANELQTDLLKNLASWVVSENISRSSCDKLLKHLKNADVKGIPLSSKTLLATPNLPIKLTTVSPGEYYHFGIANYFLKCKFSFLKEVNTIEIDIGIDGLPLFSRSSSRSLWPIIGAFVNRPQIKPFLIGCYSGISSPSSSTEYLKQFAEEVKKLYQNGIDHPEFGTKIFKIRAFSCDAPAKSFVTEVMGHASKRGCSKCFQVGTKLPKSSVQYCLVSHRKRTDENFSSREDPLHHHSLFRNTKSVLENVGMLMVSQFPVEPMHLIDLGVCRKILDLYQQGHTAGLKIDVKQISSKLVSFKQFVPSEFQRLPRSLQYISLWKSTEFRQFLLYTGIPAISNIVSLDLLNHFTTFHCAVRILSCPKLCITKIEMAEQLLDNFVARFGILFGSNKISYNVHNLLHICDCVKQFGHLDSFSAYKFENYMQYLKKKIRSPTKILQQLRNRLEEEGSAYENNSTYNSSTKYTWNSFIFNTKKEKDKFCLIQSCIPICISRFSNENHRVYVYGYKCLNLEPVFTVPINSQELGINQYSGLDSTETKFDCTDIDSKLFRIPFNNKFALFPLLHKSFMNFVY